MSNLCERLDVGFDDIDEANLAADEAKTRIEELEAALAAKDTEALAMVAAAYEKAAATMNGQNTLLLPQKTIRALTPADARAALEARERGAWNAALREAADLVIKDDCDSHPKDLAGDILALREQEIENDHD